MVEANSKNSFLICFDVTLQVYPLKLLKVVIRFVLFPMCYFGNSLAILGLCQCF